MFFSFCFLSVRGVVEKSVFILFFFYKFRLNYNAFSVPIFKHCFGGETGKFSSVERYGADLRCIDIVPACIACADTVDIFAHFEIEGF